MVLQGILAKMGLGGLQGLSQGGGFGLGYGFMVRAGYDLYGQARDKIMQLLTGARYTPDTGTSMMGTGGLMGLSRTDSKETPDTTSLSKMQSDPKYQSLVRRLGASNAKSAYQKIQGMEKARQSRPIHPRTGKPMNEWYYQNVYLRQKKSRQAYYDRKHFIDNFKLF